MSDLSFDEEQQAVSTVRNVIGRVVLFLLGVGLVVLTSVNPQWGDVARVTGFLGGAALATFGVFGGFLSRD